MTKARDIASAIPAPSTVSSAELGFLDGVTSAIQTQVDAKTAKSTLTTTGDIYYASAANTPARLAIGSTSNVLTVAGGIPSWAAPASGGMTLLSTTTLSGASTTVSVAAGYVNLFVVIYGMTNATANREFTMRTQQTGASSYAYNGVRTSSTTSTVAGGPEGQWNIAMNEYLLRTDADNVFTININDYANTSHYKTISWVGNFLEAAGTIRVRNLGGGTVFDNAAITSLVFANPGGNFSTGTVLLYGVK